MLVTVEWCTWGVDVGSTLNWNAKTVYLHTRCIYIHAVYIQYWGEGYSHIQSPVLVMMGIEPRHAVKHGISLSVYYCNCQFNYYSKKK